MSLARSVELLIKIKTDSDESNWVELLEQINAQQIRVHSDKETVSFLSDLPSNVIERELAQRGADVVFRGQADVMQSGLGVAVCILRGGDSIQGVVKTVQEPFDKCIVDGAISGLIANKEYQLSVREYGDISHGWESTGSIYHPPNGIITEFTADNSGKATFLTRTMHNIDVPSIIGRSLVLSAKTSPTCSLEGVCWGIIARTAGLHQNVKKICTCSGKTVWEEKSNLATN